MISNEIWPKLQNIVRGKLQEGENDACSAVRNLQFKNSMLTTMPHGLKLCRQVLNIWAAYSLLGFSFIIIIGQIFYRDR